MKPESRLLIFFGVVFMAVSTLGNIFRVPRRITSAVAGIAEDVASQLSQESWNLIWEGLDLHRVEILKQKVTL